MSETAPIDLMLARQQRFEDRFEALVETLMRAMTIGFETVSTRLDAVEQRLASLEQRISGFEKIATRFSNDSLLLAHQIETARTRADEAHLRLDAQVGGSSSSVQ